MPRQLSSPFRASLSDPRTSVVTLVFATITHPDLSTVIRVVTDTVDYARDGHLWRGMLFDLELVSDSEGWPRGRIGIPNVDRAIGAALRSIVDSPELTLEVLSAEDWEDELVEGALHLDFANGRFMAADEDLRVRWPIGTPAAEYTARHLWLRNVHVDAMSVTAEITGRDYSSEPWPKTLATQGLLPGLYR